jgi:hypothetical protein
MTSISVVCCDASPENLSRVVAVDLDMKEMESRVIETIEQELEPHAEREMHNAAHHETHGPVTYLQEVHEGGFSVFVGKPDALQEHYFSAGTMVAFMDDVGPGHSSKVGAEGIRRTLRVLKGHLDVAP